MRVRVESFYNIDVEESPPDIKGNFIFHLTEEEFNKVLKLFTENLDAYIEDALKSKGFNLYGRQDFNFSYASISFKSFKILVDILFEKIKEYDEKIKEANLENYLFAPALVDRIFSSGGFKDLIFRNSRFLKYFCKKIVTGSLEVEDTSSLCRLDFFREIIMYDPSDRRVNSVNGFYEAKEMLLKYLISLAEDPEIKIRILNLSTRNSFYFEDEKDLEDAAIKIYLNNIGERIEELSFLKDDFKTEGGYFNERTS